METLSYVYMMGSTSRHALYTGVTAVFYLRVWQHKNNQGGAMPTCAPSPPQ
jgi:predicted GIY-YIG superfamily endonuclease